jgi:glycosyltransferase involved in cell wall biosynthesis
MKRARRFYYSTPDLRVFASPVRADSQFLPNPIDTRQLRPLPRAGSGPPRVLLLSRFEREKGQDIAVAMARALRRRLPAVEIDAFDWGPLVAELADPGVVRLIPTVPYREIPELLCRYDLLFGQFQLGAMGMMELEAMACGKPLLSYFKYPEVYDEPPPLYSTVDPAEGAEIAASLLSDAAARRQAGEKGRAWVEAHHNFIEVARTLEGHYRAALGDHSVSHARADSDASLSA